ncbi:MAG TPA: M12 family metallopeptidase [Vicinamibacterales bacterium]|nr:M12 family metallopeptidase [Vicinamibacterales bacterium]
MSTRVFYRRGKKVELEQLDGVVAQPMTDEERAAADAAPPAPTTEILGDEASGAEANDLRAFRRAGWQIMQAEQSDEVSGAARPSAPVFRDPKQNRLLIGTKRVAVKFRPDTPEADATGKLARAGVTVLRQLAFTPNLYQVEVGAGQDAIDVAAKLQDDPAVEYAEPELIEHLPSRFQPTDPQYARQWQWNNDGSLGGKAKADVRAELAWDNTRGKGIRVAVIDNGFDVTHPDLSASLDQATGFFLRTLNGDAEFKRTLAGFPDENHGTFCAGMVGAREGNAQGGCGAAPESSLLLVACLTDQIGSQVTLARAVAYAAQPSVEPAGKLPNGTSLPGADVIACSLGPNNSPWAITSVLEDALNFAATKGRNNKGIPIFWAVDNAPNPVANDEVCSHEKTIAVGRSTRNDKENGSAFGPELDFLAPGVDVFSTTSGGGYGTSTGTSFAAPCAAGVAALVLAAKPAATAAEVRQIFKDSCDKIGGVTYTAGRHDKYGSGRINAARAVDAALGNEDQPVQDDEAAPPPLVGPQFPVPQGNGETQWTAPSVVRVKLSNEANIRELEASIIDGRAVFEGDIVLTRGLETLGVGHSDIGRRWPNRTVVYDIHPNLPNAARVAKAIAAWEAKTVIRFKRRELERDYVLFRPGSGCSSAVGMIGGVQFITLGPNCNEWNTAHEIGHAVGLWHEQSREDRDIHVTVHWENIAPDAHHNFRQQIEDGDDINDYDHDSLMHYSSLAFSINGLPTIVPKASKPIGQRDHLSDGDVAAVAKMYNNI